MNFIKIRNILNMVFMILAIAAVVIYFVSDFQTFMYVACVAIFVKVVENLLLSVNVITVMMDQNLSLQI